MRESENLIKKNKIRKKRIGLWRNVCRLSIPFFTSIVSVLFWQLPSALLPINFLNLSERLLLFDAFKNKELRGCEKFTFSAIFSWDESELGLGLKAVTGPDSAEATEITECVRTEFTEKYGKLQSSDTGIQRRYR